MDSYRRNGLLEKKQIGQTDENLLAQVMSEVEQLSPEEVEAVLETRKRSGDNYPEQSDAPMNHKPRSLSVPTLIPPGPDPFEKKLLKFFEPSVGAAAAERLLDDRLSTLIGDFLRANYVHTDIELRDLVEYFKDSWIADSPIDVDDYLDYLADTIVPHSTHLASPRFIGHMTSALPYFVRPLAKLVAAMNQNVVKMETAKTFTPCERQVLAQLHRLVFDFPASFYQQHIQHSESTLGLIVSGGTAANIAALWCARNTVLGPKGAFRGVASEGLPAALNFYGYQGAVVIGSSLMHYSFEKAADLLGIGVSGLIRVPANRQNQIDLRALCKTIAECRARNQLILALVGVAGATDSGGIDPLTQLAEIAREAKIHFHVDAAWGGPVLFSKQHRRMLAGIEQADTVVIDGHKQFYLPMGIGMLLLRNPHLAQAIEKQASYIVRRGSFDLGRRALEGSRPGMVLLLHAALHLIGRRGYEYLIDEGIRKTQFMAELIRSRSEFELLSEPMINIALYRYIPERWRVRAASGQLTESDNLAINQFNECLQKTQRRAGRTFVSRTTKNTTRYGPDAAVVALRAVIANPLTMEADIEAVLDDQCAIAAALQSRTDLAMVSPEAV